MSEGQISLCVTLLKCKVTAHELNFVNPLYVGLFPCRHLNCTPWTCDKECNYCTEAQCVPPADLLLPWSTGKRRRKLKCFFKASVKLQECTSHISPSLRTYPLHLGLQCLMSYTSLLNAPHHPSAKATLI